jgi:hypothetical protein
MPRIDMDQNLDLLGVIREIEEVEIFNEIFTSA